MAQEMNVASVDKGVDKSFEVKANLEGKSSSEWYIIPAGINSISVAVTPENGASCVVQTTMDTIEDIKADNEITGIDWDAGIVSSITADVTAGRVNAVRCIQKTAVGKVKFTVNC